MKWGICRKRLNDTLAHMRERIQGRLSNKSDNTFKIRKLFKLFDKEQTGYVSSHLSALLALAWR